MIDQSIQRDINTLIDNSLESGASVRLKINGDSMRPWLCQGDTVVVRRIDIDQLRPGNILVIRTNGDLLTHRLIAVNDNVWLTKGDASPAPDKPVSPREILGRVESIERSRTIIDLQQGWVLRASHFLAWLSLKEASAYHIYQRSVLARNNRLKWLAQLYIILFRLPIRVLASLWR
jgi:hypothetical protein